jgi:hypothetical protein
MNASFVTLSSTAFATRGLVARFTTISFVEILIVTSDDDDHIQNRSVHETSGLEFADTRSITGTA